MPTKLQINNFIKSIKKDYPEKVIKRWSYILLEREKNTHYAKIANELKVTRQRIKQIETFLIKKMSEH